LRIVLVYHDPGLNEGFKLIDGLASKIEMLTRLKVSSYPISSIEEETADIGDGDVVFALLPFRGGHLAQVREYATKRGALLAGKIPLDIIARRVAEKLLGCRSVTILYWKAKRFIEEQEEDLRSLVSYIRDATGVEVELKTSCSGGCSGCIVVSSFLPGRLTLEALESGGDVRVPYLFELVEEDIVAWVNRYLMRLDYLKAPKVS